MEEKRNKKENTEKTQTVGSAMSHSEKVAEQRRLHDFQRKRKSMILCICVIIIAVVSGSVLSCTIFFNIEKITVKNSSADAKNASEYYTSEEIIKASGIETGKNLVVTDTEKAGNDICSLLPYIGNASVKRKFPNAVVITVTDTNADFSIRNGNGYILFDKTGKVLDNATFSVPDNSAIVVGVEVDKSDLSSKITFTDNSKYTKLIELCESFEKYGIKNITKVDLTSVINIKFVCDNTVTFTLGSTTDIDEKMKIAAETYKAESEKGITNPILIDLSVSKKAYVRPDSKQEELETTTEEQSTQNMTQNSDKENTTVNDTATTEKEIKYYG